MTYAINIVHKVAGLTQAIAMRFLYPL